MAVHRDRDGEVREFEDRIGDAVALVAEDKAQGKAVRRANVVDAPRRLLQGDDLGTPRLEVANDVGGAFVVLPRDVLDRADRRPGDHPAGALGDPGGATIAGIGRMTGNAAEVEPLNARRVAQAKDRPDVRQAPQVVAHNGDRPAAGQLALAHQLRQFAARSIEICP